MADDDTARPDGADSIPPDDAYYYDTRTGEVHRGRQSSWTSRLGPYRTREEALKALETARRRTDAWDEEERRERGD